MARIPLLGGAYKMAGLIAGAQRSVNVYSEKNPEESQSPVPVTQYPRPGLTPLSTPPAAGRGRALYAATNGDVYAVIDQNVFYIDPDFRWTNIGSLLTPVGTPVLMADNGQNAIVVDGDPSGNNIDLATRTMTVIGDPNFMGGNRVDFLDGYLTLNEPGTPNFYCSEAYQVVFNALFFGTKTAWPDNIQTIIAVEREMWLLGVYKSEVWYNAGQVPFPFSPQPGLIVEHGCCAVYSASKQDVNIFWLSQSPEGARMAMKSNRHIAERISTHAIEAEWLTYPRVDDAIGQTFQVRGHAFWAIHFPTADRTWCYDVATKQWFEIATYDNNGIQHRWACAFSCYAYGKNLGLDWRTGALYQIDETNFTDNNVPIVCIRSLPHILDNENYDRVTLWKVIADLQAGTASGTVAQQTTGSPWSLGFSNGFGGVTIIEPPTVSMRVSRDRGFSWGNARMMPMGASGLYNNTPTWNRNGYGRDFIIEFSWSTPMSTALNGAFIEVEKHDADT